MAHLNADSDRLSIKGWGGLMLTPIQRKPRLLYQFYTELIGDGASQDKRGVTL